MPLWKMIAAALLAVGGVTVAFCFARLGHVRASAARARERKAASLAWGILPAVGIVVVITGVVVGVLVLTDE